MYKLALIKLADKAVDLAFAYFSRNKD
jgi:hypothetical protein